MHIAFEDTELRWYKDVHSLLIIGGKQPKCLWIVEWLSLKDDHNLLSENQCQRLFP